MATTNTIAVIFTPQELGVVKNALINYSVEMMEESHTYGTFEGIEHPDKYHQKATLAHDAWNKAFEALRFGNIKEEGNE